MPTSLIITEPWPLRLPVLVHEHVYFLRAIVLAAIWGLTLNLFPWSLAQHSITNRVTAAHFERLDVFGDLLVLRVTRISLSRLESIDQLVQVRILLHLEVPMMIVLGTLVRPFISQLCQFRARGWIF